MIPAELLDAAQKVRRAHDNADEVDDGDVRCRCGELFPTWDIWGDHYADAMFHALVGVLNTDPGHVIEFRAGGWTIKHPLACRDDLFACPVNRAAEAQIAGPPAEGAGRYQVALCDDGTLRIGEKAS